MGFLANIILGLANVIQLAYHIYIIIIIGGVFISWVNADRYNPLVRTVISVTEPVYYQIRRYIPFVVMGSIDFSPLVLILALQFINYAIIKNLFLLAQRLSM
jgi:YggT family protein